ncbi:Formylglycine-generating enzyme, required for sulfatase activity, contains SUMF1/FGE domain [Algoriphagus alkaliphilus]|uniref:Formylglycine-generating enzyme, required for sulfatase activity, contains SUMF1/FGE domain n=1 Tax=Algoriphagus alkaliphilus TaxID=279824 RepID=A0A1G5V8X4_9BACT|nr:formylglycine-generating enzyme family protein [Algoriphagus alkaliphilus]SDA42310.1 Formylglycine-generating enzyme, required for sulfatase activity, contains SUMF1/FGE domain [Algoriphagus alkaliphilus]
MKISLMMLLGLLMLAHLHAQTLRTPPLKPEVVFVKGGTFKMGTTEENKVEMPVHAVTVSDFSIGKYEVTVSQYRAFCKETGRKMPSKPDWEWVDNYPMVKVSYYDALAYCKWLGEKFGGTWRLPTEAEWEYAARGGSKRRGYTFAGGDDVFQVCWFYENSKFQANPVGLKTPNELGIYDMCGNAGEWCEDWFYEEYYSSSPKINPKGPTEGTERVMRGGNWYLVYWWITSTRRSFSTPDEISSYNGFRVVLSN